MTVFKADLGEFVRGLNLARVTPTTLRVHTGTRIVCLRWTPARVQDIRADFVSDTPLPSDVRPFVKSRVASLRNVKLLDCRLMGDGGLEVDIALLAPQRMSDVVYVEVERPGALKVGARTFEALADELRRHGVAADDYYAVTLDFADGHTVRFVVAGREIDKLPEKAAFVVMDQLGSHSDPSDHGIFDDLINEVVRREE